MRHTEKQRLKGYIIAGRKETQPRDRFFEDCKTGREIEYWNFKGYINKLSINRLKEVRRVFVYGKKEEKKQLKCDGFIKDYFEYLLIN